jgi:hypothetical protein
VYNGIEALRRKTDRFSVSFVLLRRWLPRCKSMLQRSLQFTLVLAFTLKRMEQRNATLRIHRHRHRKGKRSRIGGGLSLPAVLRHRKAARPRRGLSVMVPAQRARICGA